MLRLISRTKTGEFFKRGEWTKDANEAQAFPDVPTAFAACAKHKLKGVELYFWFDSQGHFLSVPLCDDPATPEGTKEGTHQARAQAR